MIVTFNENKLSWLLIHIAVTMSQLWKHGYYTKPHISLSIAQCLYETFQPQQTLIFAEYKTITHMSLHWEVNCVHE